MDVETFETLRLIAKREKLTPEEAASRLFGQAVQEQDYHSEAAHCWEELSPRQKQVAAHIYRGDTTRQIAAELHVSQTTIKSHVEAIFRKFGVNRREALRAMLSAWDLRDYL